MALTKSSGSITQLTAAGTSTTVSPTGIGILVSVKQSNGTGTVTAAGTAQIQYKVTSDSSFRSAPIYLVTFSTATAAVDQRVVSLPPSVTDVNVVWVVPTGASSPTLDATVSWVTP